jgi:polysaccharide export outer membrane protein
VQLPEVSVTLAVPAAQQMITGQHLVAPDGTISLGSYGRVLVVGMTLDQAKQVIESHLSQFLEAPQVSVDVFAYNSKFYYVITQGAGLGDGVARFPITGNETVLDAIANINGLEAISSKKIWIARPSPAGNGCDQILPVDWPSVTMLASTATNYQILPGDRVYVAQDKLVAFDTKVAKITSPFERIFGFTLLGSSTVQRFKFFHRFNGGGGGGGGP